MVVGLDEEDFVGVGAEAAAFSGHVVGYDEVEVFFGDFGAGVLEEVVAFGGEAHAYQWLGGLGEDVVCLLKVDAPLISALLDLGRGY